MMKCLRILIVCLIIVTSGCGYGFYGRGGGVRADVPTVFVESFINTSNEANVEIYVRNALIDAIIARGGAQVVSDKATAAALISGRIESVSVAPLALVAANVATHARATMVLSARLLRQTDGMPLWESSRLVKSGDYSLSTATGAEISDGQKQEALSTLCADASALMHSLMFSGF